MGKKKPQGHYCKVCHTYRANEKFSGKGHASHICKECNRELQQQKRVRKRANKQALDVGLRPLKNDYPKTARQAASYLQIDVETFEARCAELGVEPCGTDHLGGALVHLYDIEAMIAVYLALEQDNPTEKS